MPNRPLDCLAAEIAEALPDLLANSYAPTGALMIEWLGILWKHGWLGPLPGCAARVATAPRRAPSHRLSQPLPRSRA